MFLFKKNLDDSFFDDINGHRLDKYQRKVLLDNSNHLLVVAGAGSGKTLTIVGKVKYLIEKLGYNKKEILCLSFTNETVNNLKEKLNYDVDVYTFHKLALEIIRKKDNFRIAQDNLLEYIASEYFYSYVNIDYLKEYFSLEYEDILSSKSFSILKMNIITFIRRYKCSNLSVKDIKYKILNTINEKEKIFLIFAFEILYLYEEEKRSIKKIDFDDMIILATNIVKYEEFKYRYIIIDEYQDISPIRFNLVKSVLEVTRSHLMCVGDDYQSIYGFSGSHVELFINFFNYFRGAKRIDIKNTYRNSYELIKTSVGFIKKNPYQLRKNIHATFFYKYPVVLVYYEDDYLKTYQDLLNYLYLEDEREVMVLARYNKDLDEVREREVKGINIKYLTVHMSKGLEADNVIILNMSNSYLGFPSKIKDDFLVSLLYNNLEEIPYAEERRLFYVALTRTRKRVYLLIPRNNPSEFIKEIRKDAVELLLN